LDFELLVKMSWVIIHVYVGKINHKILETFKRFTIFLTHVMIICFSFGVIIASIFYKLSLNKTFVFVSPIRFGRSA
jgi:biotin transporter BioY